MTTPKLRPVVALPGVTRIDLYRQTETDSDDNIVDVPLSPVGIDMGDGLILDTNGNIGLLVPEAMGQDWSTVTDFDQATIASDSMFGTELELDRRGRDVRVDNTSWGATDYDITNPNDDNAAIVPDTWATSPIEVSQSGSTITIDDKAWGATDYTVRRENGTIFVDSDAWGDAGYEIEIEPEKLTVQNDAFLGEDFEATSEGQVIEGGSTAWLGDKFQITETQSGAEIENGPLETDYSYSLSPGKAEVDASSVFAEDFEVTWKS